MQTKTTEATISIFLPSLENIENEQAVYDTMASVKYNGQPYEGALYGNKIVFEDSNDFAILFADRILDTDEAKVFYEELMEYHQGIGHNLSEEELAVRDDEVKTKWLNGNFNWWCLGAGKLEEDETAAYVESEANNPKDCKNGYCCNRCGSIEERA